MVIARAAVASNAKRVHRKQFNRADSISLAISNVDELFEEWDESGAVMSGFLEKRAISGDVVWFQRKAMLNKDRFALCKLNSTKTSDYILLRDIDFVRKIDMTVVRGATGRRNSTTALAMPPSPHPTKDNGPRSPHRMSISAHSFEGMDEDENNKAAFEIHTSPEGRNLGTVYCFRAENEVVCQDWVDSLSKAVAFSKKRGRREGMTLNERFKARLGQLHDSNYYQFLIAFLILANFCINVAAAEFLPEEGSAQYQAYEYIDVILTCCFTIELAINMYVHWWREFFSNSWSVFDLVVVGVSLLALVLRDLPAVSVLRLVRVFRVIRVFQWFRSLKIIINAITAAVVPVLSSFMVLFLMTCIYAMMAFEFFAHRDQRHFGNFSKALFTMFQVCTGDGWANNVVRPLFRSAGEEDDNVDGPSALFFVSFVLIVGTVLLNIVVAVLLDEFITSVGQEKAEMAKEKVEKKQSTMDKLQGTLDPVLSTLASFNNVEELNERINKLWQTLNSEDEGEDGIGFVEMHNGLRKLNVTPPINFSEEDWEIVTEDGALCNEHSKLDSDSFIFMLKRQLKAFVQRHTANAMCEAEITDPQASAIFFVLKQQTISLDEIALALSEVAAAGPAHAAGPAPPLALDSWARVTSNPGGPRHRTVRSPGTLPLDADEDSASRRRAVRNLDASPSLPPAPPVSEGLEEVTKVVSRLEGMVLRLETKLDQRLRDVLLAVADVAASVTRPDSPGSPGNPSRPPPVDKAPAPAAPAPAPARGRRRGRGDAPAEAPEAAGPLLQGRGGADGEANPSAEAAPARAPPHRSAAAAAAGRRGAQVTAELVLPEEGLEAAEERQRGEARGRGEAVEGAREEGGWEGQRRQQRAGGGIGGERRGASRVSPSGAVSSGGGDSARGSGWGGSGDSRGSPGQVRRAGGSEGGGAGEGAHVEAAAGEGAARRMAVARASAIARMQDGLRPHWHLGPVPGVGYPPRPRRDEEGVAGGGGGMEQGVWPALVRAPPDALA